LSCPDPDAILGEWTYSGGMNVLYEEALTDKFFQVPPVASTVDSLVSLVIVEGTVLLCSGEGRIVLDWFRAPDLGLVFDGIINLIDEKS